MNTRCAACGRPLRDGESRAYGMGPKCRQALGLTPPSAPRGTIPASRTPVDHEALARSGQLAIPIRLSARVPARRRRGRPIVTVPDIDTYQGELDE